VSDIKKTESVIGREEEGKKDNEPRPSWLVAAITNPLNVPPLIVFSIVNESSSSAQSRSRYHALADSYGPSSETGTSPRSFWMFFDEEREGETARKGRQCGGRRREKVKKEGMKEGRTEGKKDKKVKETYG
jgi:hypothetical protein